MEAKNQVSTSVEESRKDKANGIGKGSHCSAVPRKLQRIKWGIFIARFNYQESRVSWEKIYSIKYVCHAQSLTRDSSWEVWLVPNKRMALRVRQLGPLVNHVLCSERSGEAHFRNCHTKCLEDTDCFMPFSQVPMPNDW